MGYRWYDQQKLQPLFPFGFGLSYADFELSKLHVSPAGDGGLDVSLHVHNIGPTSGIEVPQVYLGPSPNVPTGVQQPVRKLVQFHQVQLNPGQSKDLALHVDRRELSYWSSATQSWVMPTGPRQVFVGTSSRELPLQATAEVSE
jgi:beta-glucosidase